MSEEVRTSGWIATTVGEVATLIRGITYNKEQAAKSPLPDFRPVLRANNINGTLNFDDLVFVPQILINSEQLIKAGDIIFAMSSGSKHLVGKSARAKFDFDGSYGAFCGLLRAHEHMDKDFLYYVFQNNKFRRLISEVAKGSNINNLKREHILNFEIALPPLPEQHRIVAKIEELFSELDKGIENLKTAQAQLKVYRQALLKHAFEGKLTAQWRAANPDKLEPAAALLARIQRDREQRYRQQLQQWQATGGGKPKAPKTLPPLTAEELAELPELPEGWGWVRSGELFESVTSGSRGWAEYYAESGAIFVRITNMDFDSLKLDLSPNKIQYVQPPVGAEGLRTKVIEGDFLFSITGYLGMFAIAPQLEDAYVNQHISLARPLSGYSKEYFGYYVTSQTGGIRHLNKQTKGAVKAGLGLDDIHNFPVPICSFDEQLAIVNELASRLSEADQLDQTLAASLQQSEALRQSILKKAFSGQLVAQNANDEPAAALLARIKSEKAAAMAKPRKPKQVAADPAPEKSNVIPFPVRIPNISATDLHAGILARAYQHHENAPKYLGYFGHVKAEKIAHMVEAYLGIDLEREPIKDAAGPNDYPHLMKVESRARKANWFDVKKKKDADAYAFSKKHGFDALLLKTMKALGERADEVDALINLLLPLNSRQAEIVATLYAAWNNLLLQGQSPDDEAIVHEARENWHASKLKIERDKFFRGLRWMREHGLVPAGRGRFVAKKS